MHNNLHSSSAYPLAREAAPWTYCQNTVVLARLCGSYSNNMINIIHGFACGGFFFLKISTRIYAMHVGFVM